MTTPAIAIVGAGPCGLTIARLLECKGIEDYVVFERDESPSLSRTGGSLDIHAESGQRALRECGLFDKFTKKARYEDTVFAIADQKGDRLLEVGQGRDAPEIDRAELRQLLLESVPQHKIKWDHALQSVMRGEGGRHVLQFKNAPTTSGFKLVIGADGAWSKVRPVLTRATPLYTGKSIVVSSIDPGNHLYASVAERVKVGSSLSIGSGKYIMAQRQGDGSYRLSFGLQAPEGDFSRNGSVDVRDSDGVRQLLLSQFYADWSEDYKAMIRHSTSFQAWPLYTLSRVGLTWHSVSGATLAGDAAHLSYPGGEGVNLAMTDAWKLASKIAEHGPNELDTAVQEYEADMFARASTAMAASEAMERVMYSTDPQAFVELICS